MITGVHHIGIIVSDREKAIEFYGDVLGGELLYTSEAGPEDIAKHLKWMILIRRLSDCKRGVSNLLLYRNTLIKEK